MERSGCKLPVCKIDQNVIMKLFAEQIGKNVTKTMQDNKVLSEIKQKVVQKDDQSTQGIGGMFGELFKGMVGPLLISACVMIVMVIAFVMLKPKKIGKGGVEFGG